MTDPGLPPLSVAGRVDAVLDLLGSAGCDSLVVTDPSNIRWCTGFTGSTGVLIITSAGATLITDSRYQNQAPRQLSGAECGAAVEISPSPFKTGSRRLQDSTRVGLEASSITWAAQRTWADAIGGEVVATDALILELRSVKTSAELARIEVAASIVDESLAEAVELIEPGTRERDLAATIDAGMRGRGSAGPSFDTIVATGPNSALPHATPGDRAMQDGDLLVVDCGAVVDGYRSDMTRTFVVGDRPASDEIETLLEVVAEAQHAGVESVAAGVEAGTVDSACRDVIEAAGYGDQFGHGTGHGVGLDIHELPAVRKGNTGILQPGHVLTVEPGIYVAGLGGVRIEDTVVVTTDGFRVLTRFPKNPLV